MTLHLRDWSLIPETTAQVARKCFPKGNVYMKMRDELGVLYLDNDFVTLFRADCGQSGISPGQLALVSVMQFAEGLTDRQTADAVRSRIDWKYALALEITDSGFDYTVLSEFRSRLIACGRESELLNLMLVHFQNKGWLKARGKARTDSTHVLAAIRQLNRLECVGETLRHALNQLATVADEWLLRIVNEDWYSRYATRFEQYRLPKSKTEQRSLALTIGCDGHQLLAALYDASNPEWLRHLKAVEILRCVWVQQYELQQGQVYWREADNLPPNKQLIQSPYDIEARNRTKREMNWTGYTLHLTETCDDDAPHLITNVETTSATTADVEMTQIIHQALADKNLLPDEHIVDTGYVDAQHLLTSQTELGIDIVGRVPPDSSWQAQAQLGFDASSFTVDWHNRRAICPQGHTSQSWHLRTDNYDNPVIQARFHKSDCTTCPVRSQCTHSPKLSRVLTLKPQPLYEALSSARARQNTQQFKQLYSKRAGVESSLSQGIRAYQLRRTRYIGLAKTHLQHIATAAAINLSRMWAWWSNVPIGKTRVSRFAALFTSASS
ncbi:IS1182 family transposase [Nostoc sp. UIC 10630]|uniref:IS1182 family transposase n=1 Tax=Nostoc sp. UIC 10630 TaxID=2100146 RepID=UPI0013D86ECF|nr:IS1182 family transposase [Nostoc sp. UIC 10630]NEU80291.1 IS1182 family transposase [Nostoc sp. UIC 10630]